MNVVRPLSEFLHLQSISLISLTLTYYLLLLHKQPVSDMANSETQVSPATFDPARKQQGKGNLFQNPYLVGVALVSPYLPLEKMYLSTDTDKSLHPLVDSSSDMTRALYLVF